ncbi:MAG: hypothetical protein ACOCWC_02140 [Bacteroidota bacterium]
MEKDKNIRKEIEKFSELSSIPKQNPFVVPENYFETLSQDINKRIHKTKSPSLISALFPRRARIALVTLSAMLVLAFGFFWMFNSLNNEQAIDDSFLEEYLVSYYEYNPSVFYQEVYNDEFYENDQLEVVPQSDEEEELLDYIMNNANFYMMSTDDFDEDDENIQ